MEPISLAYIVAAVLIAALAVIWIVPWFRRRRVHLHGWWHESGWRIGPQARWHIPLWQKACDESLERARERRR